MTKQTRRISVALTISLVAAVLSVGAFISPASAGTQVTTNSCQNSATGTFADIEFTHTGTATPNPIILNTGDVTLPATTSVAAEFPSAVLVAGYNLTLLVEGLNIIPGTMDITLLGSNTVQGSQTLLAIPISGQTTITDPDGTPGTGDESATPLVVSITIPATTWTPTGGDIELSDGGSLTIASVAGGLVEVQFTCLPGNSVNTGGPIADPGGPPEPVAGQCITDAAYDCDTRVEVPASAFDTIVVDAPPTAPVCSGASLSVGAGQSVVVDLNNLCTDVNGNIDGSTYAASTPTAGTVNIVAGVATYDNTNVLATSDSFTFTVSDTDPLVSNTATVTVTILGNLCDATGAACSLNQIITVPVVSGTLTLEQTNQFVVLSPVFLNGSPQVSTGALNSMTVTNARGDLVGWTVSGYSTDLSAPGGPFVDPDGPGPLPAVPECGFLGGAADALCIPGDNLGWSPSAAIVHDVINGDVAAVSAGPSHAADGADWLAQLIVAGAAGVDGLAGLGEVNVLCSAGAGTDGGTFQCDAALYVGVPASAAAGNFSGALVLTLL